jgi:hypothetical protein
MVAEKAEKTTMGGTAKGKILSCPKTAVARAFSLQNPAKSETLKLMQLFSRKMRLQHWGPDPGAGL